MFKKIVFSLVCASMVLGSGPGYSKSFGKSGSTAPTVRTAPSVRAPATTAPTSVGNQGTLSGGQSIGMSRSNVAADTRAGTAAPANNTTVAGRNPGGIPNTTSNNTVGGGGFNNTPPVGGYYNGAAPPRQFGTGALVGAAAVGALAGYMLHRDSNGNSYYTNPQNPGVAYDSNGAQMGGIPQGNYQQMGQVGNNGVAPAQHSGFGWGWLFLLLLVGAGVYFFFFRNRNSTNSFNSGVTPMQSFTTKNPEEMLRDNADKMFMDFQKSNRPSQISHIQAQSTPMFFDAIQDSVMESSESRTVKIKTLEHELRDLSQEGTQFIGSVRYKATIEEAVQGQVTRTTLDELWNYAYENGRWLLAGIDIITPEISEVISQGTASAMPAGSEHKFKY